METRFKFEKSNYNVKFKNFIQNEMAHIVVKDNGVSTPIHIGTEDIKMMDLKFERYPDVDLKRKLLSINAKFFGQLPEQEHTFFVFDGKNIWETHNPPPNYIQLPNDWWEYAQIFFKNGDVKEPTKE